MAQKVQILLVDDIDAGEADETLVFSLDGVNYEIDLSDEHAAALRDAFAPWIGHARRTGGRSGGRRSAARPAAKASTSAAGPARDTGDVRTWARENGYEVSDRGRISAQVVKAYDDAH